MGPSRSQLAAASGHKTTCPVGDMDLSVICD